MTAIPFLGPDACFDHVGVAVRSIREVAGPGVVPIEDPTQRVRVAFVDLGGLRVELIEPLGARSPIDANLQKGQSLVHLCYRVANLEEALSRLREEGLHRIARPAPAPAFDNRRIAWVFSRTLGLIELVEAAPSEKPAA
jgi:methylmalonyl-CoA/ethylmalonyl-CoA epimerase